jgi:16S rRNA (guanine527-N7)-methyltransferase
VNDVSRETTQAALDHYAEIPGVAQYAQILATTGVAHGLIGPREVPRIWSRHVANCAVVAADRELVAEGASVIDVGSGAGLPGIVWALVRPDLRVLLLEPLLRRSDFLAETVGLLGIDGRVEVVRGRAEEYQGPRADVVTARAVAPLAPLARVTLPLAKSVVLAIKGRSAEAELDAARTQVMAAGARDARVLLCSGPGVDQPTTVVAMWPRPDLPRSGSSRRKGRSK